MNHRERFYATMHYQARDRVPLIDFNFWDETLTAWREQGLPEHIDKANIHEFLGMDYDFSQVTFETGTDAGLMPPFEEQVLEDRGDAEIVQQADGVRVLRHKVESSIPQHMGHLLEDRESWEKYYKPRLDPTHPARFPADWEARVAESNDPTSGKLFVPWVGGLYGWLRDWMGMENLSYVMYDDRAWFEEMIGTVADCIVGTLEGILAGGMKIDACAMWEDMCYKGGPLMSPRMFKKYLAPQYRRITDLLHHHHVDVVWVDSDGDIARLVPLWLDAGVNCMFPLEVGTWGADPVTYRREYGRDLLLMGGFDKRILAGSEDDIAREIDRLAPLVEEGGYIPFCDHLVPPDVPFENYVFYLKRAREVWANDTDLNPMQFSS